jgi:hypothetical protein
MKCLVLVAFVLAMMLLQLDGEDTGASRTLTYTIPRKNFAAVTVRVANSRTGPVGRVSLVSFARGTEKSVAIRVTRAQFENMWSRFLSSGIDKYPVKKSHRPIKMDDYYVFVADGDTYAVPKAQASPVTTSLARQMEAYANDRSATLQNVPEHSVIVR